MATRPLAAGEVLDGTDTEVRALPAGVVAEGDAGRACRRVPSRPSAIAAGEPVHRLRVGRGGDGPVAALLPDGTRGIAVPVDDRAGCRCGPATGSTWSPRWRRATAERPAWWPPEPWWSTSTTRPSYVAVGAAETAAVAQALADGAVVLALSAGPSTYTMRSRTPRPTR